MKNRFLLIASLLLVAACASEGGTGNPLVRTIQYYSYLNGDDLRAKCVQGAESRYRLVYNALYEEQVRAYDIVQSYKSKVGEQETRVFSRGIGSEFHITTDGVGFKSNFHSVEALTLPDLVAIDQALVSSGFEKPTQNGERLHSDEFYWIAMVCRNGAFKYFTWTQNDTDIPSLPFLEVLAKGDTTGSDVNPFRIPIMHDRGGRDSNGGKPNGYFSVEVGDNGLKL